MLWPLLMSLLKAKEYLLLGERIKADKAVELGLANRVVAHDSIKTKGSRWRIGWLRFPPARCRTPSGL